MASSKGLPTEALWRPWLEEVEGGGTLQLLVFDDVGDEIRAEPTSVSAPEASESLAAVRH